MFEDLWSKQSFDRLIAIDKMRKKDIDFICFFYRDCERCPLGLFHRDLFGEEKILCVDATERKEIENALDYGEKFVIGGK